MDCPALPESYQWPFWEVPSVYSHFSPSLASVLPGNPYLFLICFILNIGYLEPFHCPQMSGPIFIFLTPFSFHILYFFFLQSVFPERIKCFYFFRKWTSAFIILSLLPFTGSLLFSVFLFPLMLYVGLFASSHLILKNTLLLLFLSFPLSLSLLDL